MGLLQGHLNKIIRFQEEDLIVYEPKAHHLLEIRSILEESVKFKEDLRAEGDISTKSLKYLMKILTNIGDEVEEIPDEEFIDMLENNSDRALRNLVRELIQIINEVVADMQYEQYSKMKLISDVLDTIEGNANATILEEKLNKLVKDTENTNKKIRKNKKSK